MAVKDTVFENKNYINCRGKLLDLSTPAVMGILNVTPDSFYDRSRHQEEKAILLHTEKMLSEGAAIIDIGAVSTRPGADLPDVAEELSRLTPVLETIRKKFPKAILSVDTFRSEVASVSVRDYEVDIINDISAGSMDHKMFETIAGLHVPYIIMHMQGTPENMQKNPHYQNVVQEVIRYFSEKINMLKTFGVHDVIIDPGFGFGKTTEHNYEMMAKLDHFKIFELPLLAGVSRKSMINKVLNCKPEDALNGTTVLNTIALMKGAKILRVHDVREAVEAVRIYEKLS